MKCQHSKVLEWLNSNGPSWRICNDCGYSEESWHWPGFKKNEGHGEIRTILNSRRSKFINKEEFLELKHAPLV